MADPAEQRALDQARVDGALDFEDNLFTPLIPSTAGSMAISSAASRETIEETVGSTHPPAINELGAIELF